MILFVTPHVTRQPLSHDLPVTHWTGGPSQDPGPVGVRQVGVLEGVDRGAGAPKAAGRLGPGGRMVVVVVVVMVMMMVMMVVVMVVVETEQVHGDDTLSDNIGENSLASFL